MQVRGDGFGEWPIGVASQKFHCLKTPDGMRPINRLLVPLPSRVKPAKTYQSVTSL